MRFTRRVRAKLSRSAKAAGRRTLTVTMRTFDFMKQFSMFVTLAASGR